jgi:TRAP-type C4-dicarboxylate transport system permease small subunit
MLIWTGGAALLAATAVDTVAVVGRQVGMPLRGSIELIQAAVLIAGTVALICATLADRHARVRLIVDRLRPRAGNVAERSSDLLTALFLLSLLAGSAWLAVELWSSHERSEIVGVPWRWLRFLANLGLAAAIVLVFMHAVRRKTRT